MSPKVSVDREPRCSFCGKRESEVERVIAGPSPNAICSECVELCLEILVEEREGGLSAVDPDWPEGR